MGGHTPTHKSAPDKVHVQCKQCDFRFDLFLVLLLVFQLFFRFIFVLVFIIFSF